MAEERNFEGEFGPTTAEAQALQKELDDAKTQTGTRADLLKAGCGWLSISLGCAIYWILDALSDIVVTTFVSFASVIFDAFVEFAFRDLSQSAFVRQGFSITLGIANMFFVLILLWIAIATIFDFEPYTYRQLLLKLILAALLINFSLPIARAFIGLSNGIAKVFYSELQKQPGTGKFTVIPGTPIASRVMAISNYAAVINTTPKPVNTESLDRIIQEGKCEEKPRLATDAFRFAECETAQAQLAWEKRFNFPKTADATLATGFSAVFWKLVMVPILIFVLLAGAFFLLVRQLSLAFIMILGPLAFLAMILPATQKWYSGWWDRLTKWSFFFPAFMFFLFLSLQIGGGILPNVITSSNQQLPVTLQYLMTIALLFGSMMAANQAGIRGASMVNNWGKGLGKAVGGFARDRGWKYAGKIAEGATRIPGVGWAMQHPVATLGIGAAASAGATAIMKKGAGVEKKDVEFYTKLGNRQLSTMLDTMTPRLRTAVLAALPERRQRSDELARFFPAAGATPGAAPATPQQTQNQAIGNAALPAIRALPAFGALPQAVGNAMTGGVERAVQNLPAGVDPADAARAVQRAALGATSGQPGTLQIESVIRSDTFLNQLQTRIERAAQRGGGAAVPPRGRTDAERIRDAEERLEEFEGRLGEVEGRRPQA